MSAVHELLNPQQKEQIALSPLTEIPVWQIFNLPLLSCTQMALLFSVTLMSNGVEDG